MSKKERGVYFFKLFGSKTKEILDKQISKKCEDLMKTGIEQNTNTLARDGLWGQVCTGLGIPNTKIHRIRLQVAHQSFKKHTSPSSPSPQASGIDEPGEQYSEHTSPGSPSPQASGADEPGQEYSELKSLWKRKSTEAVVAVIPALTHPGHSFLIHHSELCSLRPHRWLTGEVMEGLFHLNANQCQRGQSIYLLNHYTAGVILFGERDQMRQHSLPRTDFSLYQAILSFVNVGGVHWKLLYIIPATCSVFLVDPMENKAEEVESKNAAKRIGDFLKMRNICHAKNDWGSIKWKGATMPHPLQQDSSSCGVIVTMMAKAVMEAFPALPLMSFGT
ncbi:uncharacterized protein LOC132452324 [Gadus macrocephalus]|uniref:uncharacterized protein LOC132452324 n=1 Tax=Gadus macrocephalus TaxID=80720 RepID=UPI0028CBA1C8|nr:uncharacterized protein LOC132452324 [Gadus macrocephalus]